MQPEHDPLLESALEEALGGKAPPDLLARTLARAAAETAPSAAGQPAAGPRPLWRAWGRGLAAAAVVVVTAGITTLALRAYMAPAEQPVQVAEAGEEKSPGPERAGEVAVLNSGVSIFNSKDGSDLRTVTITPGTNAPADVRVITSLPADRLPDDPRASSPNFKAHGSNPFVDTEDDRLSTFALEHDTGSYTVTRSYLNRGQLPPEEAIRAEEFVNYFDYRYDRPRQAPFAIHMDAAPSRYGADIRNSVLLRVGVQARQMEALERRPAVLTFVVDISGSMDGENRLGLVKKALSLLVNELTERDTVGIAVYGDTGAVHMPHRPATDKAAILAAIEALASNGSTNAEEGLRVGYRMATEAFRAGATNRVILCSDGVANVGATGPDAIVKTIVENRRKGITLSSVGFGMDTYNDHLMEQLGDKGDGHYAYVDSLEEARRIFVDNLTGTLEVVGRDVKIQLDFDPRVVKSYRLIGYVNRDVADRDFRNDAVDGGEIGNGHAATALYELKLHEGAQGEFAVATVRTRTDEEGPFEEISQSIGTGQVAQAWDWAAPGLQLAAGAAELAEVLGKGFYAKGATLAPVIEDLEKLETTLRDDKVTELLALARKARELRQE